MRTRAANQSPFLDLASGKLIRQLYIGTVHGIAIDERDERYYVGTSGATHVIAVIDRRTLRLLHTIAMRVPIDALTFDDRRGMLYADEDNGDSIWVIAAQTDKVALRIATPQDSDKAQYDRVTDRFYQNFTTINAMLVIDPASHATIAHWSTLPARRPHGLAVDSVAGLVYAAGTNGELVALDIHSGRRVAATPIARNVDQISLRSAPAAGVLRQRRRSAVGRRCEHAAGAPYRDHRGTTRGAYRGA